MKKVFTFLFLLAGIAFPAFTQNQTVTYQRITVGTVKADVVLANLDSTRVVLDLYVASHHPSNRSFPHESFSSMISKTQPTAAINGTYYDTRTYIPIGTLAAKGRMLGTGAHGIAVCFDEQNRVGFYKIKNLHTFPWKKFKIILSTGPTLVKDGKIHLLPRAERFRDPGVFSPASRSAIGITSNHKLLLVSIQQPVGLQGLAWVMQHLGAEQAVALDGGSSTALYYRGNYVVRPSRLLTNIFLVYGEKEARVSKE